MSYVYAISVVGQPFVKFGRAESPKRRLSQIQNGCPFEVRFLGLVNVEEDYSNIWGIGSRDPAELIERLLHEQYAHLHVRGEWYRLPEEIAVGGFASMIDALVTDYEEDEFCCKLNAENPHKIPYNPRKPLPLTEEMLDILGVLQSQSDGTSDPQSGALTN